MRTYLVNCDEVIDFLFNHYEEPFIGEVEFQGEPCLVDGFGEGENLMVMSSLRYPKTIFTLHEIGDDYIVLRILKEAGSIDQLPGIKLPSYIKREMIATILGW